MENEMLHIFFRSLTCNSRSESRIFHRSSVYFAQYQSFMSTFGRVHTAIPSGGAASSSSFIKHQDPLLNTNHFTLLPPPLDPNEVPTLCSRRTAALADMESTADILPPTYTSTPSLTNSPTDSPSNTLSKNPHNPSRQKTDALHVHCQFLSPIVQGQNSCNAKPIAAALGATQLSR